MSSTPIEVEGEIVDEGAMIEIPSAVGELVSAEVDMQIATAKRFPRTLSTFRKRATEMACLDEETAAECFYSLPRGGKNIEGPSARLAEILAAAWGNIRYGQRLISVGDNFLTAQGFAFDLEVNNACAVEVQRRITDKKKLRFSDDMIVVTANAAGSIALRNAILKVVPRAFWWPVYIEARRTAIGDAKTLVQRRAAAFEYFRKMALTDERILAKLGRPSIEDVTLDDLAILTGFRTAIKDGDISVDEAFRVDEEESRTETVADKLHKKVANGSNGSAAKEEEKPAAKSEPSEKPAEKPADKPAEKADKKPARASEQTLAALDAEIKRLGLTQKTIDRFMSEHKVSVLKQLTELQAQAIVDKLADEPSPVEAERLVV